ncbi:hypothetical protein Slin14017_G085130 [Septoria linicola]|nr:hypothetical protein Slin14017_G085130 [Septoria linicola]
MAFPVKPHKESETTSFLDLSAELRNRVYNHALFSPRRIDVYLDGVEPIDQRFAIDDDEDGHGLSPNILATCKQIHKKAAPVLYGDNMIGFASFANNDWDANALTRFFNHIAGMLTHVRKFSLATDFDYPGPCLAMARLPSLTTLEFRPARYVMSNREIREAVALVQYTGIKRGDLCKVVIFEWWEETEECGDCGEKLKEEDGRGSTAQCDSEAASKTGRRFIYRYETSLYGSDFAASVSGMPDARKAGRGAAAHN